MLQENVGVEVQPPTHAQSKNTVVKRLMCWNYPRVLSRQYSMTQNVYHFKGLQRKKRTDFIESLSLKQIQKIVGKVEEFPRCIIKQKCECKHCGEELDIEVEGLQNFFYLMMGHDSIASHLQMNFHLMIKAHMSLETISNMMPERIIYINLYIQDIENERKEYERLEQKNG